MKRRARKLNPSAEMRVLLALAIQPVVAGALAFVTFPLLWIDRNGQTLAGGHTPDVTAAALSVALAVALVVGVVTIIGVLPAAAWLMKRFDLTIPSTLLLGLAIGNLTYGLFAAGAGGTYGLIGLLRGVAFSSLLGLVGAGAFWAIAVAGTNRGAQP